MPQAQQGNNIADSAQINPGVITETDLADQAVTSVKIANGTIVDGDINASAAIAQSKLALSVTNTEINASAAIVDTKLATIATAGKVSGAALTLLANIPAGAGVIPAANIPASAAVYKCGVTTRAGDTASGDQTISHGCGATPKFVRISVTYHPSTQVGDSPAMSVGTYDGTNTACVFLVPNNADNGAVTGEAGNSSSNVAVVKQDKSGATSSQVATIVVSSTLITLSWTYAGTAITSNLMNIMWEAIA